jgi:tight adherence protein B
MSVAYSLTAGMFLVVLFVAIAVLWRDRGDRRLQERLAQITPLMGDGALRDAAAIVIRRADSGAGFLSGFAVRVLKFMPDSPEANVIPWKVVVVIGVAVGIGSIWVMDKILGPMQGVVAGILIGALAVRVIFGWENKRYLTALFRQLPDMVELLVSATRAGLPVSEAVRNVSREMRSPTKEVMAIAVNDMAIGRSIDEALMRTYERTQLSEYAIIAVAIGVQSQSGGALAESLQNVAEIVRQRLTIASRASALASEAKASAVILVALPFVSGGALAFVNPGYLDPLFTDPRGQKLLAIGLTALVAGILSMRWLIQNAVSE